MPFSDRLARALAFAAMASAWCWHAARAALCSVTTDEAFTAIDFAGRPWAGMLDYYDANNHVLHTLLARLALDASGWNALALRLPALAAGLLYLAMIWRLGRRWFGGSLALVSFCAVMAWAAPVAEYFSLARGYALGLAFFAWALVEAEAGEPARWPRVSVALGLSIASNLVFLIPSACLGAVLLLRSRAWRDFRLLAAPAAVTAVLLLSLPLSRAEAQNFYYGSANWLDSLRSMFVWPGFPDLSLALAGLLPLLALAGLAWQASRPLALTAALTWAAILAMGVAGVPWPRGRTGIYLSLLVLLAGLRWLLTRPRLAWLPLLLAPVSWRALPLRSHPEWAADATARQTAQRLAALAPPGRTVVVSVEPPLQYAIAFHARELMGARAIVNRPNQLARRPDYIIRISNPTNIVTR